MSSVKKATLIRSALAVVLVAVFAVAGILVTNKIADYQRQQYFEVRKFQAAAAAGALNASDIESLEGDMADMSSDAWKKVHAQLARIKKSDMRIRYVYLMRPQSGEMVFLVDAEDPEAPEFSPPGQVYYEATPQEYRPFTGQADAEPWITGVVRDRWGTWISANAYILGSDGKPVAVLGTDVDVNKALASFNQIKSVGLLYVLLTSVLLGLVLSQWIAWRYSKDKRDALRLEMDESLVQLNEELLEADRLKSEFIEAASHELRSPVTAVNIAMQVIDHKLPEDADDSLRETVAIAKKGTRRLADLVNNLLDITTMEAGGLRVERERADLRELVTDTVEMFKPLAEEKGISLDADFSGDTIVEVDVLAVKRILENLISNAIKFTDDGSVKVTADSSGKDIRLAVTDTGRGIPDKFQPEVFNRFSRMHLSTHSDERGAGLGLALTRGLAEAHGGRVWLESIEGEGSTFHVELSRGCEVGA
jgi:signal transduction histidine kinase